MKFITAALLSALILCAASSCGQPARPSNEPAPAQQTSEIPSAQAPAAPPAPTLTTAPSATPVVEPASAPTERPAEAPTAPPAEEPAAAARDRIVAFFKQTRGPHSGNMPRLFTKIDGIAFERNIKLSAYPDTAAFSDALAAPDVAAAIYEASRPDHSVLNDLAVFAKKGGKVLMLYQYGWHESNELLQDLFGVSVSAEFVELVENTNLKYDPQMLPDWLHGLTIGIPRGSGQNAIRSYLATPVDGAKTYQASKETGKQRLMAIEYPLGEGAVILFPQGYHNGGWGWEDASSIEDALCFFEDENIDSYHNADAANRMLDHLLNVPADSQR